MLDTNTVSDLLRDHAEVKAHLGLYEPADIALSVITEGELRYGLANNPGATRLHEAVEQLLLTICVLPWEGRAAAAYGRLKSDLREKGLGLAELDMMIAAHCLAEGLTLVSSDKAFKTITDLATENWRN
jgi:tRNA(fMet)-specific endonuclease VapC